MQNYGYFAVKGHRFWYQLPHLGQSAQLMNTKIGIKKLETSIHCMVQNAFQYLEPFRHGLRVCW